MKNLLDRFEKFFKENGYIDITDYDYFYADEIGTRYKYNEELSVVMRTRTISETEYYNQVIECHPQLFKATNIDEAWNAIKVDVSDILVTWIWNHVEGDDFNQDSDFMEFIDRVLDKNNIDRNL